MDNNVVRSVEDNIALSRGETKKRGNLFPINAMNHGNFDKSGN